MVSHTRNWTRYLYNSDNLIPSFLDKLHGVGLSVKNLFSPCQVGTGSSAPKGSWISSLNPFSHGAPKTPTRGTAAQQKVLNRIVAFSNYFEAIWMACQESKAAVDYYFI